MKKVLVLTIIIFAVSLLMAFPRVPVAEIISTTWCGPCGTLHAALDEAYPPVYDQGVMLDFVTDYFDIDETDPYCYYAYCIYWSADTDYYVPSGGVDGIWGFIGAGTEGAIISHITSRSGEETPVGLWFEDVIWDSETSGTVYVATALDNADAAGNYRLFVFFLESGLEVSGATADVYNWTVRDMLTGATGESFSFTGIDTLRYAIPFAAGTDWVLTQCEFAAFVDNGAAEHNIFQGAHGELVMPEYAFRATAVPPKAICAVGDSTNFTLNLRNIGIEMDSYSLNLIPLSIPADWDAYMFSGDTATTVIVASYSAYEVPITVHATSAGKGNIGVVIHSAELAERYDTLVFSVGAGFDVLVVDDSPNSDATAYADYLDGAGASYFCWDVQKDGAIGAYSTLGIDRLIWFCGEDTLINLQGDERTQMRNYFLSMGGKIILSGSGIGIVCRGDYTFYTLTLGAQFGGITTSIGAISAIGYSPLTGFTFGLDDIVKAEIILPHPSWGAISSFRYSDGTGAGIGRESGSSRIVYLGFPVENISSPSEMELFMDRCFQFLDEGFTGIDEKNLPASVNLSATPNPFNSVCVISYSIPQSAGTIEIHSIDGRKLISEKVAGCGEFKWTPDENTSAVYLMKLIAGDIVKTTSVVFVK